MPSLSVTIITKNEADNIRQCLESIAWADEIIVLDSGSDDDTVAICREFTDKVFETDWPGFGIQKNRALDHVSCDWVLSLDADEVVNAQLAAEIQQAIKGDSTVYEMPRLSTFCGRKIRHGGWYPDYVARLFPRGEARFSDDLVHESLQFPGRAKRLKTPLDHNTTPDLHDSIEKMNSYSTLGARTKMAKGRQSGLATAISHGLWTFIKTYFIRAGFLDGKEGFILAVANAEGCYYRYLKLMYMNEKKAD